MILFPVQFCANLYFLWTRSESFPRFVHKYIGFRSLLALVVPYTITTGAMFRRSKVRWEWAGYSLWRNGIVFDRSCHLACQVGSNLQGRPLLGSNCPQMPTCHVLQHSWRDMSVWLLLTGTEVLETLSEGACDKIISPSVQSTWVLISCLFEARHRRLEPQRVLKTTLNGRQRP